MTVEKLKAYLQSLPDGWVVTGHPNPDADAVISALFEAYRLAEAGIPAAPLVQDGLPREAAWLLGDLAPLLPVGEVPSGTPLVLTDHNNVTAYQNPVMAVVDHHPVMADNLPSGIDTEICLIGATTTLVAQRLRRDGIIPDAVCARILLGAILLDSEGLSSYKAKAEDIEIAAWLYNLCGEDMHTLHTTLKEQLLSETDVVALYRRDYRTYTDPAGRPVLGFAILKVWADACPDIAAVRRLLAEDTTPTRVAKIVLNKREDQTRTEVYLAAGEGADTVLSVVQSASGAEALRADTDLLFLPENCPRFGRKQYAQRLVKILCEKS